MSEFNLEQFLHDAESANQSQIRWKVGNRIVAPWTVAAAIRQALADAATAARRDAEADFRAESGSFKGVLEQFSARIQVLEAEDSEAQSSSQRHVEEFSQARVYLAADTQTGEERFVACFFSHGHPAHRRISLPVHAGWELGEAIGGLKEQVATRRGGSAEREGTEAPLFVDVSGSPTAPFAPHSFLKRSEATWGCTTPIDPASGQIGLTLAIDKSPMRLRMSAEDARHLAGSILDAFADFALNACAQAARPRTNCQSASSSGNPHSDGSIPEATL